MWLDKSRNLVIYDTPLADTSRQDEVGELAKAFESMRGNIAEQIPNMVLVAPQRRRLRTRRRRRCIRLHRFEHLADESRRSPTQHSDLSAGSAYSQKFVRGALMMRGKHHTDTGAVVSGARHATRARRPPSLQGRWQRVGAGDYGRPGAGHALDGARFRTR